MIMEMLISIPLLVIWFLAGELGFCIWRSKVLEARRPKNVNILARKNRFRLAGPAGLIYALNYNTNKE